MKQFFTAVASIFLIVFAIVILRGVVSRNTPTDVTHVLPPVQESTNTTSSASSLGTSSKPTATPVGVTTTSTSQTETTKPVTKPTVNLLTKELVAKHATNSDCWIIVSGKVYSVSSYISMHPGGSGAIAKNCGKDASQGFMTQGGRGSHSQYAYELLGTFLLGALGAPVPK